MNSKQLGQFSIGRQFVRDQPEIVAKAFHDMKLVVVRAETSFMDDIEYFGISEMFDEVPTGTMIPEYNVDIIMNQCDDDGPEEYHRVIVERMYTKIPPPKQDDGSGD